MTRTLIPPGPKGHLLLGSMPEYARDPLGFLLQSARDYGDIVRIRFLNQPVYFLYHPDHIEQVLVKQHQHFIKARDYREALGFLGKGLLISEGDFWRRQRRLAQPAFHHQRTNSYGAMMVATAEEAVARWTDGATYDIHHEMMRVTLEIVATTLFGTSVTSDATAIGAALDSIMQHSSEQDRSLVARLLPTKIPTPGNLRFRHAVRNLDTIIYRIIHERRAERADTGDLLSMLLQAQDEQGSQMTDQQLRDEALTIFLAGHETTALALTWTWYLLAHHPEVEAMLHAELAATVRGQSPTVADLPQLPFTTQVIKESMRLYPPAWGIGREVLKTCEIGGYVLPKGAQVYLLQYVTHRDARYFEHPDSFNPHRWSENLEERLPRFAYFPFGGGPRICIGNTFAMTEAILLLATFAQHLQLTLVPEQSVELMPSITLRPKNGIAFTVRKRQPSIA